MKSISKKYFAFILIFLLLNDDLCIQVKANSELLQSLRGHSLNEHYESRKKNSTQQSLDHKPASKIHQKGLAGKIRRLKEHRALAKTKDFGITFLVLLGVLIVAGIVKYYMDQRVKKALEFLNNEKKKPQVLRYYQRIQEGSLNMNYCLTLQTLSKFSASQELMSKVYEEDLKQDLAQSTSSNALKKLKATLGGFLQNRKQTIYGNAMTKDCYNTFRHREGADRFRGTSSTTSTSSDDGEAIENLDDAMVATDLSIKEFVQNEKRDKLADSADWAFSADTFEIPGKYTDLSDPKKSMTSERDVISSPRDEDWDGPGATDFVTFFGTVIDNGKDFVEGYKLFKELSDPRDKSTSLVRKIFKVLKWIFTKTHNVLKLTGNIQQLLGADNSLNFPFFSLAASVASILEKLLEYLDAKKKFKEDKTNPEYELKKDLLFYELIDELMDGLENIVTTILRFLVPLTLGISEIINMSIKIFMKFIHIGVAFFKLRAIGKLRDKIVEYYAKKVDERKAAFELFKSQLISAQCSKTLVLVRSFLDKEFSYLESKFENAKALMRDKLQAENPSDDLVNQSVLKILRIVCETDSENCLGILRSSEFNLDLQTLQTLDGERGKTFLRSYWISKGAKYGPINSAFMLTKRFNAQNGGTFFTDYIARSQSLLIQNGYYPAFQGLDTELWVCRICGNPSYHLQSVTHGVPFAKLGDYTNSIIQESVEGFDISGQSEITSFFVAQFEEKADTDFIQDLSLYFSVLPKGEDSIEKLELIKGENYRNLQNHDTLAACSTKAKKKRSKAILAKLKSYNMPVLMTVVHNGEKDNEKGKNHQFVTFLFSYYNDNTNYVTELNKLDDTFCYNLSADLASFRHNHFSLVVKKKVPGAGGTFTLDPNETNIDEQLLANNGWAIFKDSRGQQLKGLEVTYIEKHAWPKKDRNYKFDFTVYMKEVVKLTPDTRNPPNLRNTLNLLTTSNNLYKKEIISTFRSLYCETCSETDQVHPLEVQKSSYKIKFCDLGKSGSEGDVAFQKFIRRKAREAAVAQKATIDNTDKANICSSLKQIKEYFGVATADAKIDDSKKCAASLTEAITNKAALVETGDPQTNAESRIRTIKGA